MVLNRPEAQSVIQYVRETYGTELEFLWAKSPQNAVLRHHDTLKWYAVLLNIPRRKLGLSEAGNVDILDLKCDPRLIGSLIDMKRYFPGYHMNKEHWITLLLDGSLSDEEIFPLIDLSYRMTQAEPISPSHRKGAIRL